MNDTICPTMWQLNSHCFSRLSGQPIVFLTIPPMTIILCFYFITLSLTKFSKNAKSSKTIWAHFRKNKISCQNFRQKFTRWSKFVIVIIFGIDLHFFSSKIKTGIVSRRRFSSNHCFDWRKWRKYPFESMTFEMRQALRHAQSQMWRKISSADACLRPS